MATTPTRESGDDASLSSPKQNIDVDGQELAKSKSDAFTAAAVTIDCPRNEVFTFWRDFSNLASFMDNVERVEVLDSRRSHWVVKAPAGRTVEWEAVVTDEAEGRHIAWQSVEGADIRNQGRVDFRDAQGDRGTIVTATIAYDPPAGAVGKLIAKLFQREPAIQARRDLRRLKQLLEAGEIATSARTRAQHQQEIG